MTTRHLLDVPTPVDDVHVLCGQRLRSKAIREDVLAYGPALATCVACLRAYAAKLEWDVKRLEERLASTSK